jgi:hypothetical protein
MHKNVADLGQLARAMARIEAEVRDGLRHGHFEFTIKCKVANSGKRDLVIKAGKNHRFLIGEDEVQKQ